MCSLGHVLREGEKPRCLDSNTALDFALGRLPPNLVAASDQHLDGCSDCRLVFAEAVRALRERSTTPMDGPPQADPGIITRLRRGDLLSGRYLIQRFIARGGMGEVYEALDQLLGERIAVKTVVASISDDRGAVERLKLETNLSRRVTHPNVCRIFDIGVHEQVRPGGRESIFYITMEFVPGQSLGHTLRHFGPMDLADARPLIEGLVAGLHAAHRVGLVHRDFKSENVMLAPSADGAVLRPVVMDFGLARIDSGMSSRLSNEGKPLVGTVAYMAPEQVEGNPVAPATDVYALGVVMFEMATGELPFPSESLMEAATRRLVHEAPLARSRRPEVDARWEAVIRRCLERDPGRRFPSALEVLEALGAGSGRSLSGTEIAIPAVAQDGLGQGRRWLLAGGVLALAAGVILVVGLSVGDETGASVAPERAAPGNPDVAALAGPESVAPEGTPGSTEGPPEAAPGPPERPSGQEPSAAVPGETAGLPGSARVSAETPAAADPAGALTRSGRASPNTSGAPSRRGYRLGQEPVPAPSDPAEPTPAPSAVGAEAGPPVAEGPSGGAPSAADAPPAETPRSRDPEDGFILPGVK